MNSQNYQKHETGNQIPYESWLDYLDFQFEGLKDLDKEKISQAMKDIMIDCHLASLTHIDQSRRPGHKLEVLGFDFILDEDLRVWLIEVNTCPFMGPVLTESHPNYMLDFMDDVLKLTIDNYFFDSNFVPSDTHFELLASADESTNKRSIAGLREMAALKS